jgi:hypothetical protein
MKRVVDFLRGWIKKLGIDCLVVLAVGIVLRLIFPGWIGGKMLEYSVVAFLTLNVSVIRELVGKWYERT